jgi:uncharacterized protein YecT (DUF1311 family)
MRTLLILASVAALAIPAAAAAAPPPPVVKEGFTLLPCPKNPQTTLALEGCAEHRIVKSDAIINAKVKRIYGLLNTNAAKTNFVLGERAWLAYRKASCKSRSDVYEGGTLSGVVFANCVADVNDVHVKDLTAFEKALLRH